MSESPSNEQSSEASISFTLIKRKPDYTDQGDDDSPWSSSGCSGHAAAAVRYVFVADEEQPLIELKSIY